MEKKEPIIISLGGSLIVPDGGINTEFLKKFNEFIRKKVAEGRRFFIICGGGTTSRHYADAADEVWGREIPPEELDWLAIHATRLNAHLLRTIFKDIAYPKLITHYDREQNVGNYPVVIGAGWKPGWSTDYDAVLLAKRYQSTTLINLSNIEMVYTKDPKKHSDAVRIEKTNWEFYRSLVGDKWTPNLSAPFDPIASALAQRIGLTVIILKGDNFDNLEKVFAGEKFVGTVITPLRLDGSFYDREYFEGGKIGEYKGYTTDLIGRILRLLRDIYRAVMIKILLRPKSLLDVGCGTGEMLRVLRLFGVNAQGVDISEYLLSRASPKIRKFLKHGDILALPYKGSSFDVVTTFDVLEHISTDNLKKAAAECDRVAKKFVLHKIFTGESWFIKCFHGLDISHISVFGKSWWEKFWEENGYKLAKRFYPRLPIFMETLFLLEKKR